ncbi:MAG: DUF2946 domain-containing protein [Thermaceae bacterium]|nr:DUF2946 domain-containing protein [Thermaceae bacterium]
MLGSLAQPQTLRPLGAALGLVLTLLLSSTLVALRGVAMQGHMAVDPQPQAIQPAPGHRHHATPKTHSHLEHCLLCFTQLVEVPGIEAALASSWVLQYTPWLWLYEAQARDLFLQSVAARGPPQG